MTTAIKRRRGTTTQHSTFTGLEGEITVDSTKDTVVVHDGSTAGGFALLREDLSNNTNVITTTNTKTLTNKTFSDNPVFSAGTANGVAYLNGSKVLTTGSALTFDGTNLGVGISSPLSKVSVVGGQLSVAGGTTGSGVVKLGDPTDATPYVGIYRSAAAALATNGNFLNLGGYDGIVFTSGPVSLASQPEQMRLTSTGLGIGTSSPASRLHCTGTFTISDTSVQRSKLWWDGTTGLSIFNTDNTPLCFGTSNTERMRLDSSGNLGLGVTPSAWNTITALQAKNASFGGYATYAYLNANTYYASGWKYIDSAAASRYEQSAGGHQWHTAPSGTAGNAISFTQAMTLDASGKLGIGTSGPAENLTVYNATRAAILATGGSVSNYFTADSSNAAGYIGTGSDHPLVFITGATERMRIDSSGNLLVGTTTTDIWLGSATNTGFKVEPNGTTTIARSGFAPLLLKRTTASTGGLVEFAYGTSAVGTISTDGTGTTYGTLSDYRLKENIQPMQNALDVVAQLNPVTYTWKADGSDGQGFIAHELQAVVPDCVTGEKDAVDKDGKPVYQGVDTSFLVATLTKAVQEQQEQINQLTARVAQLEGK